MSNHILNRVILAYMVYRANVVYPVISKTINAFTLNLVPPGGAILKKGLSIPF